MTHNDDSDYWMDLSDTDGAGQEVPIRSRGVTVFRCAGSDGGAGWRGKRKPADIG